MPLAILLQERLGVLTRGVAGLRRWGAATDAFALVLARLRSAYLVRWFGTPLPVAGLELRVAFVNLGVLRARWLAIGAGRRGATATPGPNLLEPLLGSGGAVAGALAWPLNSMLLGVALGSLTDRWLGQVGAVLNWLSVGLLGSAVITVAGLGLVGVLLAAGIGGQIRPPFDFLGAVAELVEPLRELWAQVTGPRDAVRNPLLREVLTLGDRAAALLALLLGAFAVMVTRVGPLLDPMRLGILATADLARELWSLVRLVVGQVADLVPGLVAGPDSVSVLLGNVLRSLTRLFTRLGAALGDLSDLIGSALGDLGLGRVEAWWRSSGELFVSAHTIDHPTVAYLRSFLGQVDVARAWRARATPPAPATPPSAPGLVSRVVDWGLRKLGMPPPLPPLPRLPGLPPLVPLGAVGPAAALAGLLPGGALPMVDAEAIAVLRRAQRPPSVFAGEWAALRAEAREPEPLARSLDTATYLSLARRIVSPGAAKAVRGLEDLLSRLDASIRAEPAPHPLLDVPEPSGIRPVIRTLRVRAPGRQEAALRVWVDELRVRLEAAPYPVPAGA